MEKPRFPCVYIVPSGACWGPSDITVIQITSRPMFLAYAPLSFLPVGGLSGIKRPTSESSEEPPGKKAISEPIKRTPVSSPAPPPPAAKINPARPGQDLPKENPPVTSVRKQDSPTLNRLVGVGDTHDRLEVLSQLGIES